MEHYYRPERGITGLPEWSERIGQIADAAPGWDIGSAVSNPMWMQLILEKIIERHGLRHIHELWPNFSVLVHGGVFFEPYRPTFEQLLGKPVQYIDSYMASEGFFAYQNNFDRHAMRLLTDGGIFFEFIPFTDKNFKENGDLRTTNPEILDLSEVREGVHYALLLSTCAGAWRYLLGDTVQFTDVEQAEIRLTGRTKQFLSACGEHVSIDNLNEAVRQADLALRAGVREFTVAGVREGSTWAHHWYVACENSLVRETAFAQAVDEALCRLNDDYAVERIYALKRVKVQFLRNEVFLKWLDQRGKLNGQAKVPRVLKGAQLADFTAFVDQEQPVAG
ncbi:MAG: GH3 auxin-responsive promoter family protein, partial [Saprospiraceae bacterium]